MDKLTASPYGNYKTLRYLIFSVMCGLTLFCIVMAVRYNIFRDRYICLHNLANISSMIFATVMIFFLPSKMKGEEGPRHYLTLFLLNLFITAFFTSLQDDVYQLPGYVRELTVLGNLYYFFSMAQFLTLWLYQKEFLGESAVTRVTTALISIVLAIYTVFVIINFQRPILFLFKENGFLSDDVVDSISITADVLFLMLLCIATFSSNLNVNRKFSFLSCIFAPVLFVILSMRPKITSHDIEIIGIITCSIVLPLCLIFFNAHNELENDIIRREKDLLQLQVSAMISQMQPHFLYNSLAVIEALCEEDPKLAAEATSAFSDYLRENMNFAVMNDPISFSDELNHIKTYVWLEKLRFPNKLNIEYDTQCTDFPVPALSVQPMVENAIKHGICKSKHGGTVKISSFETGSHYGITVCDDGIGFDAGKTVDDGKRHLGIENTRFRIHEMVGGSLDITSVPEKGTMVKIIVPKSNIHP